jgi:flavin reductase (DIM6/NTAB) family NADH-FMN oxidoreductase RutF
MIADAESSSFRNDFRNAMRLLASSVYVVTSRDARGPSGITATAVCSLSFDPLSMLVCINRSATLFETITKAGAFALNLLSDQDKEIAIAFGRSSERDNRFIAGDWEDIESMPVLSSAVSAVICDIAQTLDFGSHQIIIGCVRDVRINQTAKPLLYVDGGFALAQQIA